MAQVSSLSFVSLSKSFRQAQGTTTILENAHYVFHQGVSYALTGVSGVGKSTLIHLLAGIDEPEEGGLFFDGCPYHDLPSRREFFQQRVGIIFQVPSLIDELSVLENVMIKGLIAGDRYADAAIKAAHLLEKVGLADRASDSCRRLSGGEQQRVAVARALFTEPAFILADEPTAHLDEQTGKAVIELLLTCQRQWQAGLIVASHDPEVARLMDVVLRLEGGKLLSPPSPMTSSSLDTIPSATSLQPSPEGYGGQVGITRDER
jgi:ABC-type lipoprotein export system ATPase subunit